MHTTVADVHRLWEAFLGARIVSEEHVAAMTRPRSEAPEEDRRYGLGFWLHPTRDGVLVLEGYDAGVSFRSVHDRDRQLTWTVASNTSAGAWPVARHLEQALG